MTDHGPFKSSWSARNAIQLLFLGSIESGPDEFFDPTRYAARGPRKAKSYWQALREFLQCPVIVRLLEGDRKASAKD
jgi:hypothetical protein